MFVTRMSKVFHATSLFVAGMSKVFSCHKRVRGQERFSLRVGGIRGLGQGGVSF
jgi:hypothetical protein